MECFFLQSPRPKPVNKNAFPIPFGVRIVSTPYRYHRFYYSPSPVRGDFTGFPLFNRRAGAIAPALSGHDSREESHRNCRYVASCLAGWAAEGWYVLGTLRKAMFTRFQPLMETIAKVKSTNSFSSNCRRACS